MQNFESGFVLLKYMQDKYKNYYPVAPK